MCISPREVHVGDGTAALTPGWGRRGRLGKLVITNPDLPRRFRMNAPLNDALPVATFYGGGFEGYTDYPTWQEADATAPVA